MEALMAEPEYELFALRYATPRRARHRHFIGGDPHDGPMPMDYFVWAARTPAPAFVIDIGFTAEFGEQARAHVPALPGRFLALLGVDPATVEDVILTHMHYDHVGNFHNFPKARFHLQERGDALSRPAATCATTNLAQNFEVEDVSASCG